MRKIGLKSIAVLMMTVLTFCMFVPTAKAEFKDLRPDHWCYNKIVEFEEKGFVSGYDDGEFKPDQTITRAEYVTIVNNFFGYEADTENTAEFLDVSEGDWFEPYVSEAVKRGYISGYPDGTFKPHDPIRRQEATIILAKIIDIHDEEYAKDHEDGLSQYEDGEEVSDWAYQAVHSYSVYNFINGYEDNTIRLFRNVSRAETVQLLNTVEEKVVIDRDNKTNEVKDKPSGGSSRRTTATPVINIVESNDDNIWYNFVESGKDDKVTVKVTTSTANANITVKVNGEVVETNALELEAGSGVSFELSEGEYEIVATATRNGYKTSNEATSTVKVDTSKPVVSGKINEEEKTVALYAKDNLSGIDNIQYAWFINNGTDYVRVSNWENISDTIDFPTEPQNYYIGIKGSDIAGNRIDGGLKDSIADVYDEVENPDGKVNDEVKDEPYDILKEIIINENVEDKEENQEQPIGDKFITFHKNDGTDKIYRQNLESEGDTTLETGVFSREEYTFNGWAETANGTKVYEDGATVNFEESEELYAVWELNEPSEKPVIVEVKISIEATAGANGTISPEGTIEKKYGESQEYVIVPNDGYEIADVVVDGESVGVKNNYVFENITENHAISAIFSAISYTIEYDLAGGTVENENPTSYTVESEDIVLNNPTKVGYTFTGWTGTDLEDAQLDVTIAKGSTGDRNYTANFEKDSEQTKKLSYTVEHWVEGEKTARNSKTVEAIVWTNEVETLAIKDISLKTYAGYKYESNDKGLELSEGKLLGTGTIENGSTIKVNYVKDESQWHTITFVAGNNGTLEGTTSYSDILTGTAWDEEWEPTPVADEGYEFEGWNEEFPSVVTESTTYIANFVQSWVVPNVTIDQFESTNVSNSVGNRAEQGTVIEYKIVITNNEEVDNALIDIELDSDMELVSPATIENITLKPGESIVLIAEKTVPENYEVAGEEFEAEVEVFAKNGDGVEKKVDSEVAENKIEKTATVKKGDPVNKNIVMTIDFSGSMLYCCSHDRPNTSVNEIFSITDDGKKYQLCKANGGSISDYRLRPNHYYKETGSSNVLYCSDISRIRALQLGFNEFVDKLYGYYQMNDIDINIEIVLFASQAKAYHFNFSESVTNETIKNWFETKVNTLENNTTSTDTGSRDHTNIKLGIEEAKKTLKEYESAQGDTYSIYFGDGGLENSGYAASEQDCNDIRNEYATNGSYVIGFGPFDYDLLKTDLATENKTPYVLHAFTKNDIINALSSITDEIILNEQSYDGIIEVEVDEDGKFYPIIATYNDDGVDQELFNITKESELANNSTLELTDSVLSWDISGYTEYSGLKLYLGENIVVHDIHEFADENCGTKCSKCEEIIEHEWEDATCTKPKTCKNCEETKGEALGHTNGAEATCTEAQICTVCEEVLVEKLGHEYEVEECGAKCIRCEDVIEHEYETEECEAKCIRCEETIEHEWEDATCTKPKTCKNCEETKGEALGHTKGAEATCTEAQICTVCEEVLVEELGHDWIDATYESPKTCNVCGETEGTPLVPDSEEVFVEE